MSARFETVQIADVLHVARAQNASDIHFVPDAVPAIRVDGVLRDLDGPVLHRQELATLARSFGGEAGVASVEEGRERSFALRDGAFGDMRIHMFRVAGGIAIALRLLGKSVPELESLHLPSIVATFAERKRGLVLLGGPTGSGKSTTLAAIVESINTRHSRRIITIEDPIEYRYVNDRSQILQREVGEHVATFADAILGALRADPDVIVIGEMRDRKTMRAALTAAETGHLVLTTIHTGNATETIDRIVHVFRGGEQAQIRGQLAGVLAAVACQHLIKRAHGGGRRALVEVMVANDAVRNIIREGRTHQLHNAMQTGRALGMQTLADHASDLLAKGEISSSDGRAYA